MKVKMYDVLEKFLIWGGCILLIIGTILSATFGIFSAFNIVFGCTNVLISIGLSMLILGGLLLIIAAIWATIEYLDY